MVLVCFSTTFVARCSIVSLSLSGEVQDSLCLLVSLLLIVSSLCLNLTLFFPSFLLSFLLLFLLMVLVLSSFAFSISFLIMVLLPDLDVKLEASSEATSDEVLLADFQIFYCHQTIESICREVALWIPLPNEWKKSYEINWSKFCIARFIG